MATSSFKRAARGSGKGGKGDAVGLGHRTPAPHQLFHAGRRSHHRKGRR
jgi:hypothetical protein